MSDKYHWMLYNGRLILLTHTGLSELWHHWRLSMA